MAARSYGVARDAGRGADLREQGERRLPQHVVGDRVRPVQGARSRRDSRCRRGAARTRWARPPPRSPGRARSRCTRRRTPRADALEVAALADQHDAGGLIHRERHGRREDLRRRDSGVIVTPSARRPCEADGIGGVRQQLLARLARDRSPSRPSSSPVLSNVSIDGGREVRDLLPSAAGSRSSGTGRRSSSTRR